MAIREAIRQLIPERHAERIVLEDHFGHQHEITVYHVLARDAEPTRGEPKGELIYEWSDHSTEVEKARLMMEHRETMFLKSCLAHPVHKDHPAVRSHPAHPLNQGSEMAVRPAPQEWPKGDCKECP